MKTYTPGLVGALNQKLILEVVRDEGPLSRADICRRVALSFPAVSASVKALLERGLLLELGAGSNAMGRKSVLLGFNADYGYVVGVKLGQHGLRAMLCNLRGESLCVRAMENNRQFRSPEDVAAQLTAILRLLLAENGTPAAKVHCVSCSLPGVLDDATGQLRLGPYLPDLTRGDLTDAVRAVFGQVPVLFENNVNNGALGERWKGAGQGCEDLFYLHYGIGLGGAVLFRGELCRGFNRAAGEVGYMLLGREFLRDSFCAEGAAEGVLSGHAILAGWQASNPEGTLEDLFDAYEAGDPQAAALLEGLFRRVGILLTNVTSILDPQRIILSGPVGRRMFPHAKAIWQEMLENHVPYVPQIVCSELDDLESLYGAVLAGLNCLAERHAAT